MLAGGGNRFRHAESNEFVLFATALAKVLVNGHVEDSFYTASNLRLPEKLIIFQRQGKKQPVLHSQIVMPARCLLMKMATFSCFVVLARAWEVAGIRILSNTWTPAKDMLG
jgi:hypothetical protein